MTDRQKLVATATLLAAIVGTTQADVYTAVLDTGNITAGATWSNLTAPVAGDTNVWATTIDVRAADNDVFYGQTLRIDAGGIFRPLAGASSNPNDVTVRNVVLDGGLLDGRANQTKSIHLGGNTLTLNSGTIQCGDAGNKHLFVQEGHLAGSGTIAVIGDGANTGSAVNLTQMTSISDFGGIFDVKNYGRLNLMAVAEGDANFGMVVSGTGRYQNSRNVAFTSLVLNGVTIDEGTYTYAQLGTFSLTAQAVVVNGGGTITVIPEPAALGLIGVATVALLGARRILM